MAVHHNKRTCSHGDVVPYIHRQSACRLLCQSALLLFNIAVRRSLLDPPRGKPSHDAFPQYDARVSFSQHDATWLKREYRIVDTPSVRISTLERVYIYRHHSERRQVAFIIYKYRSRQRFLNSRLATGIDSTTLVFSRSLSVSKLIQLHFL